MNERLQIFDTMSVLSDPTRGRLLAVLERRELTVSEICAVLQLPQSTVSRHLKLLGDDGWLASRRDGTRRCYSCAPDRLEATSRRLWRLIRESIQESAAATEDRRRLRRVLAERSTRSQAFFSSAAGQWDRLRQELFGNQSEQMTLLGLLDPAWVVGDLGCGTGRTSEALGPFVRRVIAVDSSEAMLAAAQGRLQGIPAVETRRGDLADLPIDDGELDAAILQLVLHHVAEPPAALREVARALRPGGRLLIVDMRPHDRQEYRQEMGHQWLGFASEQLEEWLRSAGFDSPRVQALPPDPQAKGPALFAASARRHAADNRLAGPWAEAEEGPATAEISESET